MLKTICFLFLERVYPLQKDRYELHVPFHCHSREMGVEEKYELLNEIVNKDSPCWENDTYMHH